LVLKNRVTVGYPVEEQKFPERAEIAYAFRAPAVRSFRSKKPESSGGRPPATEIPPPRSWMARFNLFH
jgi:hypothetical protein